MRGIFSAEKTINTFVWEYFKTIQLNIWDQILTCYHQKALYQVQELHYYYCCQEANACWSWSCCQAGGQAAADERVEEDGSCDQIQRRVYQSSGCILKEKNNIQKG